jgi:hypothetical protein
VVIYTHRGQTPDIDEEATEMTIERKNEIEKFAKEVGLSFVDAKNMLEEIEADYDANEIMAELWY